MVWVIHFCSPVAELHWWIGTQKLSGVNRSVQTRQIHIKSHAYTCIHHRIQLALGDMTIMSGWKPTKSLIHPLSTERKTGDTQWYDAFIDAYIAKRNLCLRKVQESVETAHEGLSNNKPQFNISKTEVLTVSFNPKKETCHAVALLTRDLKIESKSHVKPGRDTRLTICGPALIESHLADSKLPTAQN